jgi:hypothetical protein
MIMMLSSAGPAGPGHGRRVGSEPREGKAGTAGNAGGLSRPKPIASLVQPSEGDPEMLPLSDGIPLIEASFGLFSASANGGGVAFFAHVGGFIFGLLAARLLTRRDPLRSGINGAPRRGVGDEGADRSHIMYTQY